MLLARIVKAAYLLSGEAVNLDSVFVGCVESRGYGYIDRSTIYSIFIYSIYICMCVCIYIHRERYIYIDCRR